MAHRYTVADLSLIGQSPLEKCGLEGLAGRNLAAMADSRPPARWLPGDTGAGGISYRAPGTPRTLRNTEMATMIAASSRFTSNHLGALRRRPSKTVAGPTRGSAIKKMPSASRILVPSRA